MAPPQTPVTTPVTTAIEAVRHLLRALEAFKAFDSDDDGLITAEELEGILASLGYGANAQELREMMNGRGLLGLEEFLMMNASQLDVGNLAGQLQDALLELGSEGDEAVTGGELHEALMGVLSYEDCMEIVAALDGDGDGSISLEDLGVIVQALL